MTTPKLVSYLRLMRFGNVFSAIADIAMGFVVVNHGFYPLSFLGLLCASSAMLFLAGMVLNDVYDIEVDREHRSYRPLPSGEISLSTATKLGYGLLFAGIILAIATGWSAFLLKQPVAFPWLSGVVGLLLAICIVGYDKILKKTVIGPLAMGGCRFFNVLLGMSVAVHASDAVSVMGLPVHGILLAAGIGTYIVGVTIFARTEATASSKPKLLAGVGTMVLGIGLLACLSLFDQESLNFPGLTQRALNYWPGILLLVSLGIIRSTVTAVLNPTPEIVQAGVKHCLLTLLILDACVCFIALPSHPFHAVAILGLMAPILLISRWIYST